MAAVLVVAACASGAPSPEPGSSATALPAISMHRSGGIAGGTESLTVAPTGEWSAVDASGRHRRGIFDAGQVASLTTLATDPRLVSESTRSAAPTKCSDAYTFDVIVGTLRVTYTDCPADADPPAAAMVLVGRLRELTKEER